MSMNSSTHLKMTAVVLAILGGCSFSITAQAQYAHDNIELLSHIDLSEFGNGADVGNDCWGYVSNSGREYALMGLWSKTAIVDITDPLNPNIVGSVPHNGSDWSDIKVYGDFMYVSNESGGGCKVADLSDIDNGNITVYDNIIPNESHNLVINEESGFLYMVGSKAWSNGLIIYDLKDDPSAPSYVGYWRGEYIHDANIVTMHRKPYLNREIAFCCANAKFLILDVTDKSNIRILSESTYPGRVYCHQGWLSADQRFFYLNDEGDEIQGTTPTTRTIMFDVTDIRNPEFLGSFTTGDQATDHNLYVHDQFVYEANYRSGMHIFDASDPVNPIQVGYFDTYPANNRAGYNGAWSVYPFFPSGTVIISDIERGLFIVDPTEALRQRRLQFDSPSLTAGQQGNLDASNAPAGESVSFIYSLNGVGAQYVPSLNVMIGLAKPKLIGSTPADGAGNASLAIPIPNGTTGLNVYFQAIANGRVSNVTQTVIN